MTNEQLTRLEKMHSETQPSAPAEIYQWFPEIAKALREALARCDTLRGLADEKAYESGLYARRMEEAQKARTEARVERDEAYRERADWMHSLDRAKADIALLMKERDEARAEVERLRAVIDEERALACEEPDPKCSCPGCSYAREKAVLKEEQP